jgi:hypothetical protein
MVSHPTGGIKTGETAKTLYQETLALCYIVRWSFKINVKPPLPPFSFGLGLAGQTEKTPALDF